MATQQTPAIFVADAAGLDFLNSIATPSDTTIDWIDNGDGLLNWLEQAHLVPTEALEILRTQALPGELDKIADQARNLREWFREIVNDHKGRPLTMKAIRELEPLNRLLERDEKFSQIGPHQQKKSAGLKLQVVRRWRSPESLLLPIGEALADLVCEENFTDVKSCEGLACTLLFVDRTRRRARRWCSMAICGNRAKQAAHRSRAKTQS